MKERDGGWGELVRGNGRQEESERLQLGWGQHSIRAWMHWEAASSQHSSF